MKGFEKFDEQFRQFRAKQHVDEAKQEDGSTPAFARQLAEDYGNGADGKQSLDEDHDEERAEDHADDPLWEDPNAILEPQEERPDKCPIELLSEAIAAPVKDWMRHIGTPALLPVICALSAISVALGRGLKALSNKTWTYPNIFGLMGAETGSGKSLVYDEAMRPLVELQAAMEEAFEKEIGRLKARIGMAKAEISAKHGILQSAIKSKEGISEVEKQILEDDLSKLQQRVEDLEDQLNRPPCIWTSDFTSEALGVCLKNNDERVAVLSDEGSMAMFNILGRYNDGNVTDDALLCKCFSVNSHGVNRLSRGRITLNNPCVALLLIVQPDILRRAYKNVRLMIGGFLARCFSADTHLQVREETEESAFHFDQQIADQWNKFIKDLFAKYHEAKAPYKLQVDPKVRTRSRAFFNKIARLIRGRLHDVRGFAIRWNEQAWKVAELLHVGIHGTASEKHVLTLETFENATKLVTYFITLQLEVLVMLRIDAVEKTHTRLLKLFERYQNAPIRIRELERRHGLQKDLILECARDYPKIYGIQTVNSANGGSPSMYIFLRRFKPKNFGV